MTMQQRILDKVEESFKKAETFYGKTFPRPRNIIFKRNGTVGGSSNFYKKEFMFQLDFAEAYPSDYLEQTVPHEVAHWIDDAVYGYQYTGKRLIHHGKTWKYVMNRVYGLNPDRCHSYDSSLTITKKQTRYEYSCSCMIHRLSATKHNRIVSGKQTRRCNHCKQTLVWKRGNVIAPVNKLTSLQAEIEQLKKQLQNL